MSNITSAQAIDAILGQFKADDRVTAYQVAQIAEAALEVLGVTVKISTQPVYNATKGERAVALTETNGESQAMRVAVIKPIVAKLVAKGLGQAVGGGKRIDKDALKASAMAALTAAKPVEKTVEAPKPNVVAPKPAEQPKKN
jgi:hypothetical protein